MSESFPEFGPKLNPVPELAINRTGFSDVLGSIINNALEISRHLGTKEVVASAAALVAALTFAGSTAQASPEKSHPSQAVSALSDRLSKANRPPPGKRTKRVAGLKCSIGSIKQVKDSIVATGGCTIDGVAVPKKSLAWTWKEISKGYAGVCEGPTYSGTGKGSQFGTPKKPAGALEDVKGGTVPLSSPGDYTPSKGTAMPPSLIAEFNLSATQRGQTARVTRKSVFINANSYNLCGPPPELHNYPGEPISPTALTWETIPTLETPFLYTGSIGIVPGIISTRGNGNCTVDKPSPVVDTGYLIPNYSIKCDSGVAGWVRVTLIRNDGVTKCTTGINRVSYFPYPNDQYSGELKAGLAIDSWDPSGAQYPYVTTPNPNANFFWDTSKLGGGYEDPCDGKHPYWSGGPPAGGTTTTPTQTTP